LKGGEVERHEIHELLKQQYDVDDLSDDEVAKLHIRYLIGGHANLKMNACSVLNFQSAQVPY